MELKFTSLLSTFNEASFAICFELCYICESNLIEVISRCLRDCSVNENIGSKSPYSRRMSPGYDQHLSLS